MSTTDGRDRAEPGERGGALVLAVDDDTDILSAWPCLLAGLPIRLRCLESAEQALEAIRAETPDVLVSDQRMPGMTGLELIELVREKWPAIQLGLHTSDPIAQSRATRLRVPVLEKGASAEALRSFIEGLLRG